MGVAWPQVYQVCRLDYSLDNSFHTDTDINQQEVEFSYKAEFSLIFFKFVFDVIISIENASK